MTANLLNLSNPVFANYVFYGSIVSSKMIAMSFLTAAKRIKNGIFANPEDAKMYKKVVVTDEAVERVRRNHLNDLENIPIFLILALFYVTINPSPSTALWHFRIFTASRIIHTLSYQLGLQPFRGLAFGVGVFTCASMLVQILQKTM